MEKTTGVPIGTHTKTVANIECDDQAEPQISGNGGWIQSGGGWMSGNGGW